MNPEKCPHCGAEEYTCGIETWSVHGGSVFSRSAVCYERQIAALKEEIKRAAHELWCEGANGRDGFRSEWIADWNNSRAKQIAEGQPLPEPPKE